MNSFQQHLLNTIERYPGANMRELALALGYEYLSTNHQRYLRWLVVRGLVECKQVTRFKQRGTENIYRRR